MAGVVVFDRMVDEGATFDVEVAGRMIDRFTVDVSRPVSIMLTGPATFALHEVDPESVPGPTRTEGAQVALVSAPEEWRRARWDSLIALPEGRYLLRYGHAEALLVLGPEDDE